MKKYSEKPDDVLVELTLLGNEEAFEELVLRHEKSVKGTAFKVTHNSFSAEDASQDAFVSAWIRLDTLSDRSRFGAWVCAIAKNCARDLVIHYRNTVPDISLHLSDAEEIPDLAFAREEEKRELRDAVGTLTEKIREVIRLHYFEGCSVEEIAEKLSLPAGTVKWRLSEGRKQLRKGYGIVEKEYNEQEKLLARVMRQVEELKLWRLKSVKTGFEEDYRRVLANVESLEESREKQHALADVLLMGYWWLSGERNDETFAKIKQTALESHNEDVMESVISKEYTDIADKQKRIEYLRDVAIPLLVKHKFVKALGYAWFWYGVELDDANKTEKPREAFSEVTEILKPSDVYYANALSALRVFELRDQVRKRGNDRYSMETTGETLRFIGKKLYFWNQPGFSRGSVEHNMNGSVFWNCSQCDGLIWDPDAKLGERVTSANGKATWTLQETERTVETPAGVFSGCTVTKVTQEREGVIDAETTFCPGIGIVRQKVTRYGVTTVRLLSRYTIKGGEGLIPFAAGNCWEYVPAEPPKEYVIQTLQNRYEVTSFAGGSAILSTFCFLECVGYTDTFAGKLREIRENYCTPEPDENGDEHLLDVEKPLCRAMELAATKREKTLIGIAANVMRRIFATDPEANPDFTEKGRWNFFDVDPVCMGDGKIGFPDLSYHLEWKDMQNVPWRERQVLFGDPFGILDDAAGAAWSDEWVPGYLLEEEASLYGIAFRRTVRVLDDETVETPAGVFQNCRHVSVNAADFPKNGLYYRTGKMEAWYAPGVGLVQYSRPMNGVPENLWQLTEYRGTGEGYFPIGDGFFRRYVPRQIVEGWHASVEYTFDADENSTLVFRNTLGTQDRSHYEAFLKQKEAEKTT